MNMIKRSLLVIVWASFMVMGTIGLMNLVLLGFTGNSLVLSIIGYSFGFYTYILTKQP